MRFIEILKEGGNVFKSTQGDALTQRIKHEDIDPTIEWLEDKLKIPLKDQKLGSTGDVSRIDHGDIDLAVDENQYSKDAILNQLKAQGITVKKMGYSVHVLTPIKGNPKNGFVQTDLMFGDPQWMKYSMRGESGQWTGRQRQLILSSIANARGKKYSWQKGIYDPKTKEVITRDPLEMAQQLFGAEATAQDIATVPNILKKIKQLNQDHWLDAARADGVPV